MEEKVTCASDFSPFRIKHSTCRFKDECAKDAQITYYSMAYFVSLMFLQTLDTSIFAKRRHSLDHAHRKSLNSFDQMNELASQSLHPILPFPSLRDEVPGCEKYVRAVSCIRACIWRFQSSCRTEIGTPSHSSPQPCRSI